MLVEYGPSPCNDRQTTKISKHSGLSLSESSQVTHPEYKSTNPSQTAEETKILDASRSQTPSNPAPKTPPNPALNPHRENEPSRRTLDPGERGKRSKQGSHSHRSSAERYHPRQGGAGSSRSGYRPPALAPWVPASAGCPPAARRGDGGSGPRGTVCLLDLLLLWRARDFIWAHVFPPLQEMF
jgi:hypothetical protein